MNGKSGVRRDTTDTVASQRLLDGGQQKGQKGQTIIDGFAHRMNKWQIICPVSLMAIVVLVMTHYQAVTDGRALAHAVTQQLDSHSAGIAALLAAMKTNDTSSVEDAAFLELRHGYYTSLITRADIHVTRTPDGSLECAIDTSRCGVPTRTIR